MQCPEVDRLIEESVAGERLPEAIQAHLDHCSRCATALANARLIERSLRELPATAPSPDFAHAVMTRIRQERWHAEQVLDWAFNVAVALGLALIVLGLAGLAWATGLISLGGDMMAALSEVSPALVQQVARQSQTIVLAALLFSLTLGLWWWVETGSSS